MNQAKLDLSGVDITPDEELLSAQAVTKALKGYHPPSPDKQAMVQDTLFEFCKVKKKGLRRDDAGILWTIGKRTVWKHQNMTPSERHYALEYADSIAVEEDDRVWGEYDDEELAFQSLVRSYLQESDRTNFNAMMSEPCLTDQQLADKLKTTSASIQKSRCEIIKISRSLRRRLTSVQFSVASANPENPDEFERGLSLCENTYWRFLWRTHFTHFCLTHWLRCICYGDPEWELANRPEKLDAWLAVGCQNHRICLNSRFITDPYAQNDIVAVNIKMTEHFSKIPERFLVFDIEPFRDRFWLPEGYDSNFELQRKSFEAAKRSAAELETKIKNGRLVLSTDQS